MGRALEPGTLPEKQHVILRENLDPELVKSVEDVVRSKGRITLAGLKRELPKHGSKLNFDHPLAVQSLEVALSSLDHVQRENKSGREFFCWTESKDPSLKKAGEMESAEQKKFAGRGGLKRKQGEQEGPVESKPGFTKRRASIAAAEKLTQASKAMRESDAQFFGGKSKKSPAASPGDKKAARKAVTNELRCLYRGGPYNRQCDRLRTEDEHLCERHSKQRAPAEEFVEEAPKTKRARKTLPAAGPAQPGPEVEATTPKRNKKKAVEPLIEAPVDPERAKLSELDDVTRRKREKEGGIPGPDRMCHQCMSSKRLFIIRCSNVNDTGPCRTRYCWDCAIKWYPARADEFERIDGEEWDVKCPRCYGNCNCKGCLRTQGKLAYLGSDGGNAQQHKALLRQLLERAAPYLGHIVEEQKRELEIEQKIWGSLHPGEKVPPTEKLEIPIERRVYCDNCRTTIVDYARVCCSPDHAFDLCLTCCEEVRAGKMDALSAAEREAYKQKALKSAAASAEESPENVPDLPPEEVLDVSSRGDASSPDQAANGGNKVKEEVLMETQGEEVTKAALADNESEEVKEEAQEKGGALMEKGGDEHVPIELDEFEDRERSFSVRPRRQAAKAGRQKVQSQLKEAEEADNKDVVFRRKAKKEKKAKQVAAVENEKQEEAKAEAEQDKEVSVKNEGEKQDEVVGEGEKAKEETEEEEEVVRIVRELRPAWVADKHGRIPCPAQEWGGCGQGFLELRSFKGEDWVADLQKRLLKALGGKAPAAAAKKGKQQACGECSPQASSGVCRKAASRKNGTDNYLYSPDAQHLKENQGNALRHFQHHWGLGEPVLVRNTHKTDHALSWEPFVMWRACRETSRKNGIVEEAHLVDALLCLDWTFTTLNMRQFFAGYLEGREYQYEGRGFFRNYPTMLKLKDWPPRSFFHERLPRHCRDFVEALPFHEYTHPNTGVLNIAAKVPQAANPPDLGPKTYVAYGHREELGRGDSVTKLHCDMSDAVNILCHSHAVPVRHEVQKAIERVTSAPPDQKELRPVEKKAVARKPVEKKPPKPTKRKGRRGSQLKEGDEVKDDEMMGDKVKGDEVKSDAVKDDEVMGNELKADEVTANDVRGDVAEGESGLLSETAPAQNGEMQAGKEPDEGAVQADETVKSALPEELGAAIDAKDVQTEIAEAEKSAAAEGVPAEETKIEEAAVAVEDMQKEDVQATETGGNAMQLIEAAATQEPPVELEETNLEANASVGPTGRRQRVRKTVDRLPVEVPMAKKVERKRKAERPAAAKAPPEPRAEKSGKQTASSEAAQAADSSEYGGAVWDIFRRKDVPKLKEYLEKHAGEFTHVYENTVTKVDDAVHDQTFYLTQKHKEQLKKEYNVEPWTFEQFDGEAVFIPAGCPHQVRNLKSCVKVAMDFVSPENLEECWKLTQEFRTLPDDHRAKEDKLQVKRMVLYAVEAAIAELSGEAVPTYDSKPSVNNSAKKTSRPQKKKAARRKK